MSSPVIIHERFVPRVGQGKNLRVALKRMSDALAATGFPDMELWAPMHAGHDVLVTVERYASLAGWDGHDATATRYPALVSAVFDGTYPTTLAPYDTEILRVIDKSEIFDRALHDGRRVAVVEGAVWPAVGSQVTVHEHDAHVRQSTVARVELVLGYRAPARTLVWAELVREPA